MKQFYKVTLHLGKNIEHIVFSGYNKEKSSRSDKKSDHQNNDKSGNNNTNRKSGKGSRLVGFFCLFSWEMEGIISKIVALLHCREFGFLKKLKDIFFLKGDSICMQLELESQVKFYNFLNTLLQQEKCSHTFPLGHSFLYD